MSDDDRGYGQESVPWGSDSQEGVQHGGEPTVKKQARRPPLGVESVTNVLGSKKVGKQAKGDARLKRPLRKSGGGPRTPEGRAKASQNSFKHGAYSQQTPISDDYQRKLRAVLDEINPVGEIERALSRDIAHQISKLDTVNSYHRDQINSAQYDCVSLKQLATRLDFPWIDTHIELLGAPLLPGPLREQFLKAWRVLAKPPTQPGTSKKLVRNAASTAAAVESNFNSSRASKGRVLKSAVGQQPGLSALDLDAQAQDSLANARAAGIYEHACEMLANPGLNEFAHGPFFQDLDLVMAEAKQGHGYLGKRIAQSGDTTTLVCYWLYRNLTHIAECLNELKSARVMRVVNDESTTRARAFVVRGLRDSMTGVRELRELRGY